MLVNARYRVLRGLGSGSMATVLAARDTWAERDVALKLPRSAEAVDRLLHEQALLRRFNHPTLMRVFGDDVLDTPLEGYPVGTTFTIVELCEGAEATELVGSDSERVAGIGVQIAAALAALHANGVRHGDVSPANIRVARDGRCKLIDLSLGSAREFHAAGGTLATMAPEALEGYAGAAADVYALAATLALLLEMRVPPGAAITGGPFGETLHAMTATNPDQRVDAATACAMLTAFTDAVVDFEMSPAIIVGRDALVSELLTPGHHVVSGQRGSGRSTVLEACAVMARVTVRRGNSGALGAVADHSGTLVELAEALPDVMIVDDVPAGSPLDELGRVHGRQDGHVWIQSTLGAQSIPPLTRDQIAACIRASRPLRPHDSAAAEHVLAATGGHPAAVMAVLDAYHGDTLMSAAVRGELFVPPRGAIDPVLAVASLFHGGVSPSLLRALKTLESSRLAALLDSGELVARGERVEARLRVELEAVPIAVANELVRVLDPGRDVLALVRAHMRLGDRATATELATFGGARAESEQRHDEALGLYEAALGSLDAGPPDPRLAIGSARSLLALGRALEALEALKLVSSHSEHRALVGETLIALGRYREAAEALEALPRSDEPAARLIATRARALMLAGRYDEARAVSEAALEWVADRRVELLNVAGVSAFYMGALDDARRMLSEALTLAQTPQLLESTRANLALVLHKVGDTRAAEDAYLRCIEELTQRKDLPRKLLRLTNLATLRQEIGHAANALTAYAEAAEVARLTGNERALVRVQLNQANLLVWLGAVDEAQRLLAQARTSAIANGLQLESAYLALIAAESGEDVNLTEAESHLDIAGRAEALLVRGITALRAGREHEAYTLARDAFEAAGSAKRERLQLRASTIAAIARELPSEAHHRELLTRCTDPDLAWMARLVLYRVAPDTALLNEARRDLASVRAGLPARYSQAYAAVWWRAPLLAEISGSATESRRFGRDVERLLAINRELARDHDPVRLLERIIDAAIALSGAERGFLLMRVDDAAELEVRTARGTDARELTADELDISRSIARQVITTASPLSTIDAQHDDRFREFQSVHALRLRSVLCLPLRTGSSVLGVVYLDHRYRASAFDDIDVAMLSSFGDQAAIAVANARTLSQLANRTAELEASRTAIDELNKRLATELHAREAELESVRQSDPAERGRHGLIGRSPAMREIFRVIERVCDKDVAVTINGESGTGKELVARAIHGASPVRRGPFVPINCGAIPENLLESELFGHERGAFTGAVRAKAGLFEIARDGTLFLDEIGDMPLGMQVKLLRVLQSREFRRVGGTTDLSTKARIISATNKNLEALVRSGGFREDLWYRLNVVELTVPPLRERRQDVPLLIEHLLAGHARGLDLRLSKRALAVLLDYTWPGNVRELDNELQRAVALAEGTIEPDAFSHKVRGKAASTGRDDETAIGTLKMILDRQERAVIKATLDEHNGRVAAAARALGLTRAGLYKKLHKYGLVAARDD